MSKINNAFYPNKDCKDYGLRNRDNITFRGKYGKNKKRDLLYCRTCGKRFASTRATAFFGLHLSDDKIEQIIHHAAEGVGVRATARLLNINKDTVNRVVLRAGEHCELMLSNLNWRMWDAHLTRKSLMFAKSFRWLKAKFAICVGFYNFIRPHETLSRGADRIFRPRTPAMAAGVTDHQWTIKALLSYKACVN